VSGLLTNTGQHDWLEIGVRRKISRRKNSETSRPQFAFRGRHRFWGAVGVRYTTIEVNMSAKKIVIISDATGQSGLHILG
jgi:hypothetical protein